MDHGIAKAASAAACALLFAVALQACAGLGFTTAEDEFGQGVSLFNRGLYDEAIVHFEKAVSIDPDFAQAYLYIGRSHISMRRWAEAAPPLRAALRLAPEETQREIADILLDVLFAISVSAEGEDDRESSPGHGGLPESHRQGLGR